MDRSTDGAMGRIRPCAQPTCGMDRSCEHFSLWTELPDSLLLHIFCFLSCKEVLLAAEVCRKWHRLSHDEMLWKRLLQETYSVNNKVKLPPFARSWRGEFLRLYEETPLVEGQVLREHTDEVLHVAFSHDGRLLASSSKDCNAILWYIDGERVTLQQKLHFREFGWEYVQYCEFNADDSLLLVSGVNTVRGFSFSGEICIYSLQGLTAVRIIHAVASVPYDVFGAWLTTRHYISGSLEFLEPEDNLSVSELWANCVDVSPQKHIRFCRVVNRDHSSVRTVLVAKPTGRFSKDSAKSEDVCLIYTHGTLTYTPHQVVFKWLDLSNNGNSNKSGRRKELSTRKNCLNSKQPDDVTANCSNHDKDLHAHKDHCIETHAHIIGMGLSPDHQMLYVNCRPWNPKEVKGRSETANSPPEISNDIHLRAYNLSTYQLVCVHTGHQAFTPNKGCFFIFLNVAEKLVVSGAEDKCAHVWDRHYGVKLATLKGHSNVVNSVAVHPINQEMAVSASDDHTIIVWKSRQQAKSKLEQGTLLEGENREMCTVESINMQLNETVV